PAASPRPCPGRSARRAHPPRCAWSGSARARAARTRAPRTTGWRPRPRPARPRSRSTRPRSSATARPPRAGPLTGRGPPSSRSCWKPSGPSLGFARVRRLRTLRDRRLSGSVGFENRDHAAAAGGLEIDLARALGEDRVVLPDPHAVARMELGAALANDDLAAGHGLAGEHLHAEALGIRVTAVAARPEPLLMSHPRSPSWPAAGAAWPAPCAWWRASASPPSRRRPRPWGSPPPPWRPSPPASAVAAS